MHGTLVLTRLSIMRNSLKRAALMFQNLAVTDWQTFKQRFEGDNYLLAEIEWLFERGILGDLSMDVGDIPLRFFNDSEYTKLMAQAAVLEVMSESPVASNEVLNYSDVKDYYSLRLESAFLNKALALNGEKIDTFPLQAASDIYFKADKVWEAIRTFNRQRYSKSKFSQIKNAGEEQIGMINASKEVDYAKKSDVIQIVFNTLPTPDDSVPWEKLLEFRNDPDTIGKFLGLRNWMNDIIRANLTPIEVEQKLEWMIYDYRNHIKLHKMKVGTSTLETILIAGAEFLEDLVRLKWGNLAKGLFSLKHNKIALLEEEMRAPGREIAYIVKAQEAYPNSQDTSHGDS